MGRNGSFLDVVGPCLCVFEGMIPDAGEDSYLFSLDEEKLVIGAFDGSGGIGAKKYPTFDNHTGAYIGSRVVAGAVCDWINYRMDFSRKSEWTTELKVIIQNCLEPYRASGGGIKVKGSLSKDFPTTAAFIICYQDSENPSGGLKAHYMWAGDSRGYLMQNNGLHQITVDDIVGNPDAMTNLLEDGVLSNVITATKDFYINEKIININSKSILVASSDGCFNYYLSPMHFEYVLLDGLRRANSMDEWQSLVKNDISQVASDDYTLVMVPVGYSSFEEIKADYQERYRHVLTTYIQEWDKHNREEHLELWNQYSREMSEKSL